MKTSLRARPGRSRPPGESAVPHVAASRAPRISNCGGATASASFIFGLSRRPHARRRSALAALHRVASGATLPFGFASRRAFFFFGVILMGVHNRGGRQHFREDESKGRRVLALLDGKEILGPGPDFVAPDSRQGERKYHVGNLSYDATESDLRELFQSIGTVVECHIFKDSFDGRSRGFAVLRLVGGDAFALQRTMFMGRTLRIDSWDRE
jgi:RNA recognition motif. (a.k.a. RRM, RBD, or RNP domain)